MSDGTVDTFREGDKVRFSDGLDRQGTRGVLFTVEKITDNDLVSILWPDGRWYNCVHPSRIKKAKDAPESSTDPKCEGCHSGHVEPDCLAHGVDSEQARINYMTAEERDAEYKRRFGSCEACGGRHDNCGQPDYCCGGCDKIPRSTEATFDAWWQTGEPQRILGDRYNDMEVREIMRKTWEAAK